MTGRPTSFLYDEPFREN